MSCKNLTLLHGHMIHMWRLTRQVLRRRDSGERLEVVNEMRLVVVPAFERHLRPVNCVQSMSRLDDLLKATHPREQLRRKSNLIAEQLDEPALAATDLVNDSRNRRGLQRVTKLLQCETDNRMAFQRSLQLLQQAALENPILFSGVAASSKR
jgi:hypothetical protein